MPEEIVVQATPVTPAVPAAPAPGEHRYSTKHQDAFEAAVSGSRYNETSGEVEKVAPPVIETSAPIATSTPVSTTTAAPVISTSTGTSVPDPIQVVPEKLFAGKFKTVEDMEAAYKESESAFHKKSQELADSKKAPVTPATKTPEQLAEDKAALLNRIVEDPDSVVNEIANRTQAAIDARQRADTAEQEWIKTNPDIAPYKDFVGLEMTRLMNANPELASDPAALLTQATTNFRIVHGKIRESGKLESLQVSQSVTPLAASRIQTPPPTEQPTKAPVTQEDAVKQHMDMLKANAARVRRPVR